jgi:hypothetical protein
VSTINHNWGTGGPGNGIGNDQFSARWTGSFNFNASDYVFSATADDGVRVWVDGSQIINAWRDQAPTTYRATVNLSAGSHTIKVEYYEKGGGAVAQVSWQGSVTTPSTPTVSSITPNPINLAAPPSSFTVAGSGFSNQGFGLPIVNFTRSGTLLGQARASAMSGSTSVTVPFPTNATSLVGPLPGLSAGAVTVEVYNQTGAGTYSLPGSTLLSVTSPAVTLSTTPSSVTAGASVTATWSGIVSPTAGDWIGLYVPGTTDSALITGAWVYVSCSQVQGSGGVASGSCSFPIPASLTAGTYELRLFANRSVVRLANSGTFSVQAVPPATLSATPSSVAAGANVTATWSGIVSPMPGDWIGLYVPGALDEALIAATWVYVSCSQTRGISGIAAGSCSFRIPSSLAAGTYELRLFANNSLQRLGKSNQFTVN